MHLQPVICKLRLHSNSRRLYHILHLSLITINSLSNSTHHLHSKHRWKHNRNRAVGLVVPSRVLVANWEMLLYLALVLLLVVILSTAFFSILSRNICFSDLNLPNDFRSLKERKTHTEYGYVMVA
ncbi:EC1118_1G1_4555p [Saccharomyces cerevisiae EC1118]|uniref:Putative uncharacterized protein YGR137W n=2 Tax=Saccharomyces cerevisiae TaxID=4932 RepID=YG3E_YEAST|nr:RecName: Full=Putative uncharacterized protein YGR137W [Saccharomyces cerevisiae S288C]CAA97150.1 unnamed protein product [Saccharomyces cerevisiae]CAY79896.1 EC1118_1G1_4555p [Saccharomyces cerevisiae EC1118]